MNSKETTLSKFLISKLSGAAENIFVVSPTLIFCLSFPFLFVVFQPKKCFRSCGASVLKMLFKFSSVLYFLNYHNCKQRTEVLILRFVFSEAMSSLKVFISSSVYVVINPGTSSIVASPQSSTG